MAIPAFVPPTTFHEDPYASYAALRKAGTPIVKVGAPYDAYWVLGAALVKEVCKVFKDPKSFKFHKPGGSRHPPGGAFGVVAELRDGLFFMDPPRHTDVRALMNTAFTAAIQGIEARADTLARQLVQAGVADGRIDVVGELAKQLATQVFMEIMGIRSDARGDARLVDQLVRKALELRDPALPPGQRVPGGIATLALRSYLHARRVEIGATDDAPGSLFALMNAHVGKSWSKTKIDADEAMNTAAHFALGGYLSTEFLIGSGVYNLWRTPGQREKLQQDPGLLDGAVNEMLRYDAPFQMAERWVEVDAALGGETIPKDSLVVVVYGSANRDPAAFVKWPKFGDPGAFDITRDAAIGNFGFGEGVHRCIGAPLACTVTKAAVRALVELCPQARIGEVGSWSRDPYFRSLSKLVLFVH